MGGRRNAGRRRFRRPTPKRDLKQSIARGKELFYGAIANCVKCHGDSALGDGQTTDYDDWTKELEPANADALATYLATRVPCRRGTFVRAICGWVCIAAAGGRSICTGGFENGIEGTPMPAVPIEGRDAGRSQGLDAATDIWCLVDYVRSLPYEPISKPTHAGSESSSRRYNDCS